MNKFKIIMIEIIRIEIEVMAENKELAAKNWFNGMVVDRRTMEHQIIDVQKVA